jgi:hypothetical protein
MAKPLAPALFGVAAAFSSLAVEVHAQEFSGAQELIGELDQTDTYSLAFILQRCAGVWYALGSYSEMLPQDQNNAIAANFATASIMILRDREPDRSIESITAEAVEDNVAIAKIYMEKMKDNQRMSGSIFDEWLTRELDVCNELSGALSQ